MGAGPQLADVALNAGALRVAGRQHDAGHAVVTDVGDGCRAVRRVEESAGARKARRDICIDAAQCGQGTNRMLRKQRLLIVVAFSAT